jgi:hypothetical protein
VRAENGALWALIVAIVVLPGLVGPPALEAHSSPAAPAGADVSPAASVRPAGQLGGGYVVNGAIVFVGYGNWLGQWTAAGNGSQTFAAAVIVECWDIAAYGNVTLELSLFENGYGWVQNQTVILPSDRAEVDVQLSFVRNVNWVPVRIIFDGGPTYWGGWAATPVTLLPPSILNVGGLDLFTMTVLSFVVISFSLGAWVAWRVMKKALIAPPFSLLMWGHVFLAVMIGAIIINFQWVDSTFGGWSPLVYPFPIALMFFFFMLSLFNRRERKEVLQWLPQPGTEVYARRTFVSWGTRRSDGAIVLLRETWPDFWARAFGHFCELVNPTDEGGKVFEAKIVPGISPTRTGRRGRPPRTRRQVRQMIAQIRILNPQEDDVTSIVIADGREPLDATFPRLVSTKLKHFEGKTLRNGDVVPPHDRRVWSLPHYEPSQGKATWTVKREFWAVALAVLAGWASIDDLAELYRRTKTALAITESHKESEIEREVTRRLGALLSVPSRVSKDLPSEAFPSDKKKPAEGP